MEKYMRIMDGQKSNAGGFEYKLDLINEAEVIALSTTLATNACVENKGGRAKLIFFGINPENVSRTGREYGLENMEQLIFIDSKTRRRRTNDECIGAIRR